MNNIIRFEYPFVPYCTLNSYRYFSPQEKHVTRICREYVLLFMLKNELYFTEDNRDIVLKKGEWYIQVPGLKQEGKIGSPSPVYYYIHFQIFKSVDQRLYQNSDIEINNKTDSFTLPVRGSFSPLLLKPLFDQMETLSTAYSHNNLQKQIVFLNTLERLAASAYTTKTESEVLADDIAHYIVQNYNKLARCDELKDIFHYSLDYLTAVMKKHHGITPWQYMQKTRIKKAMELLTNTNNNIEHICNKVGYNDLSVFYKAFKKNMGMPPNKWRIKSRGV